MSGRFRTLAWTLPGLAVLIGFGPDRLLAQAEARVSVEENFRREPNGLVLGRLTAGTILGVVGREGNWAQVDVEGWVWLNSLQVSDSEFDLVVSATDGENLRDGPSGRVVGHLEEGVLLDELGREPGWVHVRRRGWIWSASMSAPAAQPEPTRTAGAAPPTAPTAPARGASAPAAATRPTGVATVGAGGAPILTAPNGDTLATASARSDLQVVAREGNWARVRLEGWVWMPEADQAAGAAGPAADLRPDDLRSEPLAHVGRIVSWELQFVSRERAEAIRTDFREGEPFLLCRFGGPDGPFVYVAVPSDRQAEADGLVPLERISVTGRVRTGASSLTGTPIIDLITIEKSR